MRIEQVAAQYPSMPRASCAVVARLMRARGCVLSAWDLADALSEATGNEQSTDAVRNAITRARAAGAEIVTRHGIGYCIEIEGGR